MLTPHARLLRHRYFLALLGHRLTRGPAHIHRYYFLDEMYLNLDDTKARAARAANGQPAEVVDFDSRGKKWGQLAACCTGGLCAQFVYPCNQRSTTRDLFEWWLVYFLMPVTRPPPPSGPRPRLLSAMPSDRLGGALKCFAVRRSCHLEPWSSWTGRSSTIPCASRRFSRRWGQAC